MNLSRQIKKFREQQHFSQEDLSEKIFVSRQTISNWENGRSYPDVQNLLLLSTLFGVSLDELVKGDVDIMKHEVSSSKLQRWTIGMLLSMFVLAIVTIPAALMLGLWALLIILPIIVILMFSAIRIEQIKKNHNLQTYKEILAFVEQQKLPDAEEKNKLKGNRLSTLLIIVIITLIFIAFTIFTGYIFMTLSK